MNTTGKSENTAPRLITNYQIRSPQILLIDKNGKNLGMMALMDAVNLAREDGLDVLQIGFNKGVITAKILDASKYRYNLSLKQKEEARKQKNSEIKMKQVQIRVGTAQNDLVIKAKQTEEFIANGNQVRLVIKFKSQRELSHIDLVNSVCEKFLSLCSNVMPVGKLSMGSKEMSVLLIKKENLLIKKEK